MRKADIQKSQASSGDHNNRGREETAVSINPTGSACRMWWPGYRKRLTDSKIAGHRGILAYCL